MPNCHRRLQRRGRSCVIIIGVLAFQCQWVTCLCSPWRPSLCWMWAPARCSRATLFLYFIPIKGGSLRNVAPSGHHPSTEPPPRARTVHSFYLTMSARYHPERSLVHVPSWKCSGLCLHVTNKGESGFGKANDRFKAIARLTSRLGSRTSRRVVPLASGTRIRSRLPN